MEESVSLSFRFTANINFTRVLIGNGHLSTWRAIRIRTSATQKMSKKFMIQSDEEHEKLFRSKCFNQKSAEKTRASAPLEFFTVCLFYSEIKNFSDFIISPALTALIARPEISSLLDYAWRIRLERWRSRFGIYYHVTATRVVNVSSDSHISSVCTSLTFSALRPVQVCGDNLCRSFISRFSHLIRQSFSEIFSFSQFFIVGPSRYNLGLSRGNLRGESSTLLLVVAYRLVVTLFPRREEA